MTTTPCPSCGAASTTADYCDTCGAALGGPSPSDPTPAAPAAVAPGSSCPSCGAARTPDDVFCEVCGLDFATGKMPAAPPPPAPAATGPPTGAPSGWTAVVEADRDWFDSNSPDGGNVAFPDTVPAQEVPLTGDEVAIGRRSEQKGFVPGIDLSSPVPDPAVSHHHALLRRQLDGTWALVDEMSTNGTWLNGAGDPVAHGVLTALHDGDTLHLGAFTRITIRKDAEA